MEAYEMVASTEARRSGRQEFEKVDSRIKDRVIQETRKELRAALDLQHQIAEDWRKVSDSLRSKVASLEAQIGENQRDYDETETDLLTQIAERDDRIEELLRVIHLVKRKRIRPYDNDLSGLIYEEAKLLGRYGFFGDYRSSVAAMDEPESLRESGID